MRIVGLVILAIFLPAFAHAAFSPPLSSYTISHDTIYPSATAESGLATSTVIDIAFSEQVKTFVKIISASGVLIKTLYSNSSGVKNPDSWIWDGMNKGVQISNGVYTILISATSTAPGGPAMTDLSRTVTVSSPDATPPDTSSDTSDTAASPLADSLDSGTAEYLPIPVLRISTMSARIVSSGADIPFTAVVYDGKGNKRDDALVTWTFGDGMRKVGASVFHTYYNPGEYLAIVRVSTSDGGNALAEVVVTAKDASIKITGVTSRGIALTNNDSRTLDISLWRLSMGGQEFKIPEDTQILAGRTILFPSQVIELPIADSARLLYPSGEVAATYPAVAVAPQLYSGATSYEQVQAVEPIISPKTNIQAHAEAVDAPIAANELAAVGALPPESTARVSGIFKSPWTLGFLGTMLLAGGAFILL